MVAFAADVLDLLIFAQLQLSVQWLNAHVGDENPGSACASVSSDYVGASDCAGFLLKLHTGDGDDDAHHQPRVYVHACVQENHAYVRVHVVR